MDVALLCYKWDWMDGRCDWIFLGGVRKRAHCAYNEESCLEKEIYSTSAQIYVITHMKRLSKMFKIYDLQTGEVPTKRKNKAYAVIKNEMEERERAKKRASKNVGLLFILQTIMMTG